MGQEQYEVPVYETRVHQVGTTYATRREISHQQEATEFCVGFLKEKNRENSIVVLLDHVNKVIGVETVSIGTTAMSAVWIPGFILPALLKGAQRIIVAHNHPFGEAHRISLRDVELTALLQQATSIFQIELIDHLVIDDKGDSFSVVHYLLNQELMDKVLLDMGHTVE